MNKKPTKPGTLRAGADAVEALRRSETKLRTLYASTSEAVMLLDENSFFDCNKATLAMFGCATKEEFCSKHPADLSPPEQPCGTNSMTLGNQRIATALKQGSCQFEWMHQRADTGKIFPADVLLNSMKLDGRKVLQATVRDITERKRMESRLHDLTAHLQTVREEEKASIAREIHDDLGGMLTALKMEAYWLAEELSANEKTSPLLKHTESMAQLIDDATDVFRNIITSLRPTILDDLGLLATLEWYAAQFHKRTGIKCRVNSVVDKDCKKKLDKTQSVNLFRIFQEALANVSRHSHASKVEVGFNHGDEEVVLSISDNGCGIPENHIVASNSYGMLGMTERVEQLGGKIKFGSPPDGGFSVMVSLPFVETTEGQSKLKV